MTETPDPIYQQASIRPDATAITTDQLEVTYHDLHYHVERTAASLRDMKVHAGDRVALTVLPTVPCLTTLLAILRIGAIACMCNPEQPSLIFNEQLRQLEPSLLIHSDAIVPPSAVRSAKFVDLEARNRNSHPRLVPRPWPLDHHATIVFTSGSIGVPKAAVHSWGNHYFSAIGSAKNMPFGPGDRWLLSLPLFHVGGLAIVFRAITGGGCVVIPADRHDIVDNVIEHRSTHLSLVATQLYRLTREPDDLARMVHSLKAVLIGGGPIPDSLVKQAWERGVPVHVSYGMTEMSSQIATTPPGALPGRLGTSGLVLPHRELEIDDNSHIRVRGDVLFAGYLNYGVVRRPVDKEGWFDTGDLGRLDSEGYLWVTGRKDNLIISGGENIQAEEIERALKKLPGVSDAIVVGVPHEEFGERPVAFVQMAGTFRFDLHLFRYCLKSMLPRFKIPDAIWEINALEQEGGLKANRTRLADLARRKMLEDHD